MISNIHSEETDNSDYVMTCINTIPPKSNTLKKLLLHKGLHSYYIKIEFNEQEEITNNTYITYVEPLLEYINHPKLLQEWKLNLDSGAYEKEIDASVYTTSSKNKMIAMTATCTEQPQ